MLEMPFFSTIFADGKPPTSINPMNDDVSQPVSQRGRGAEAKENRRIQEVADELRRRCQLYEAQLRESQDHVSRLDVEAHVSELYAKENILYLQAE